MRLICADLCLKERDVQLASIAAAREGRWPSASFVIHYGQIRTPHAAETQNNVGSEVGLAIGAMGSSRVLSASIVLTITALSSPDDPSESYAHAAVILRARYRWAGDYALAQSCSSSDKT